MSRVFQIQLNDDEFHSLFSIILGCNHADRKTLLNRIYDTHIIEITENGLIEHKIDEEAILSEIDWQDALMSHDDVYFT